MALALVALAVSVTAWAGSVVYEAEYRYKAPDETFRWAPEATFVACFSDCPEASRLKMSPLAFLMKQLEIIPVVPPAPVNTVTQPAVGPEQPGVVTTPELRVYFGFDSALLTPKAKGEIKAFVEAWKGKSEGLQVFGYACPIGPEGYNLGLSQRRAEAAASYIRELGGEVLEVKGFGEVIFDPQRYWKSRCAVLKPKKSSREVSHGEEAR